MPCSYVMISGNTFHQNIGCSNAHASVQAQCLSSHDMEPTENLDHSSSLSTPSLPVEDNYGIPALSKSNLSFSKIVFSVLQMSKYLV